jgi:tetratricopeptide (TPR) repeat protein
VGEGGIELQLWAFVQSSSFSELRAVPSDDVPFIRGSKTIAGVSEVDGDFVTIEVGEGDGVTAGDIYFVLNDDTDRSEVRLGSQIGALLRVTETAEDTSIARIEHARIDVESSDIAVFAQASFDLPSRSGTVVVAPFEPDGDPEAFPAIAEAVPEYMARYGLTNIGIDVLSRYVDPRPYDASETASDLAEGDYGAVVFGLIEEDTFIFNTGAFGSAPHPAITVGILPGGLPIAIGESFASLSRQLAPSFISTVLALRGDHAMATYFVESVLATEDLEPGVRFHLREHLALRYESLNRPTEAFRIMSYDVTRARDDGLVYPLLNALSIRTHLDNVGGLHGQWIADAEEFLAVADGLLPAESLGGVRLDYAESLTYQERAGEGRAIVEAVRQEAIDSGDEGLQLNATIDLALNTLREDPTTAMLILAEMDAMDLETENRAFINLFEAELAASQGDRSRAMERLNAALAGIADSDSQSLQASVYRRAGSVFNEAGLAQEAVAVIQQAASLYLEMAQLDQAAGTLIDLAFLELQLAAQLPPGQSVGAVMNARQSMVLGGEIALRLGRPVDASSAFMYAAMLERQIGQDDSAYWLFDRAAALAMTTGHYPTLHELYSAFADFAEQVGKTDEAAQHMERALLFGRAAGIEVEGGVVSAPGD